MTDKKNSILLYMPNGGEDGVIQAWYVGRHQWVEFRGPKYSKWHAGSHSRMQEIHDAMEGWHTTVLHQNEVLMLHPKHPDYAAVKRLVDRG